MSSLYDSLVNDTGSTIIQQTYGAIDPPVKGSVILKKLLLGHAEDPRNKALTLVLSQSTPGDDLIISDETQAPQIVERVLSIVLENMMANFTTGAYSLMASGGQLM